MTDNTNLEVAGGRRRIPAHAVRGLVYHHRLVSVSRWNLVEPLALQDHKAGRKLERFAGVAVFLQVSVEVRSGQYHNQRQLGVLFFEPPYRCGALAGMQRYEQVAAFIGVTLSDTDPVTQSPQYLSITECSNLIPVVDLRQRRRNESDLHL